MPAWNRDITCRLGLIGSHLGGSLIASLYEHEADALGLNCVYERIDIELLGLPAERVGELLRTTRGLGFRGVNITHPCEQLVVGHLAGLSEDALAAGTVNTVVFEDAGAVGHNTDCSGFCESFVAGLPSAVRTHVVLLGAGGAGPAVGHGALSLGTGRLWIVDPRRERAEALAGRLCRRHGRGRAVATDRLEEHLTRADGLIHATATGMTPGAGGPFPVDLLHDRLWVAEVIHRPLETELLRHARARGCRTLDGGGMTVYQAALAFALFTGVQPDRKRMLEHFGRLIEERRMTQRASSY